MGDKPSIAENLVGLGGVATGMVQTQLEAQRGAKLLGAAATLLKAISAVLEPEECIVGVASARA